MDVTDPGAALANAWLAAIVESSDDAIISKDLTGTITSWNRAAEDLFGYTAAEVIGQPITVLAPPGRSAEMAGILDTIRRGERVHHHETVRRAKDGTLLDISLSVSPIQDARGVVIGASKIARNITERKREQRARGLLAAIVESSDDAIISKDLDGIVTSWNRAASNLFGYTAEEMVSSPIWFLAPPGHESEMPAILEKIRRGERVEHYETVRRRKDGSLVEISLTVSPIRDDSGNIVGASKIVRDISERKQAERRLRVLMAEIDHRAKNILAVAQAIVNLTRADSVDHFVASIRGRIGALARVHNRIAQGRWEGADLEALIHDGLSFLSDSATRIRISGPPVSVDPTTAQVFGIVIHELATNAVKYGALSSPDGVVRIEWSLPEPEAGFTLSWVEQGGPPVVKPVRRSFGSRLIEGQVAHQLGGKVRLNWDLGGLSCEFRVPARHLAGAGSD